MTRTASLLPDDALPPDSLVRRIIDADNVQQDAVAAAMEFMDEYADDFKALAASERAELPLWRVMHAAYHEGMRAPGEHYGYGMAAEIEALRDWLLPEEPEPVDLIRDQSRTASTAWQRWDERMSLRALLTEQARIARGES